MSAVEPSAVAQFLGLEMMVVDVDTLDPNPWNPNVMDKRTFDAERASIRMYGFIDPVTVRPNPDLPGRWQIIDGEHRWRAARDEGLPQVSIGSTGPISDEKAKHLTIIFNETRGEADSVKMGKLLTDLDNSMGHDDLTAALPYSDAELAHHKALAEVDWDSFRRETPAPDPGDADGEAKANTLVLAYDDADYERATTFIQMIGHELSLDDAGQIVLRVLEDAAKARNA